MERINQFSFFELGQKLKALRAFEEGDVPANDAFFPVVDARHVLRQLLDGDPLDLVVSKTCTVTLHNKLEALIEERYRTTESGESKWKFPTPDSPAIPSWRWSQIKTALNDFETILREELREAAIYRVPSRGIFDTAKLIDQADRTFPVELLPFITEKTRQDWCSAGRCLAFNLLSASGFHVARAVEAALEDYYKAATGKSKSLNGWSDYIKALEAVAEKPTDKLVPSGKVISELKRMKDDYRNPIVHPRVVLEESDARMLFANGESLIIAMASEIKQAAPPKVNFAAIAYALGAGGEPSNYLAAVPAAVEET